MAEPALAPADLAETIRRWLAPPVALLASVLGATCMLSVVSVARAAANLTALDADFVGWVGVGAFVAVAVAGLALLSGDRVGSGPFLSLGAVAAVFGLSLAHHVSTSGQLTSATVVCGLAVGGLLGGSVALVSTLPSRCARLTLTAWAGPLVVIGPLISAAGSGRADGASPSMAVHPSTWLLAVVSLGIVSWSVLTMLVEPIPFPDSSWMRWQTPWTAVLLMCSSAALLTALLGFSPHISLVWLRPVVVTASAAVILAWVATASLVPDPAVRLAYVAVSAVAGFVPATATFAVGVADSGRGLGGVIVVLMVTAAAGGVAIGYQTTLAVIPLGFALVAVAACGTWAMATTPWVMLVSVGPLVVFATAVLVCAVRMVAAGGPPTRVLGLALIGSLLLGQVATIPLGWAMLGDAPSTSGAMIASGRLDAGFTVAVASLAASWTWIARARLRRPAVGASPWPGSAGPPVVVTDRP